MVFAVCIFVLHDLLSIMFGCCCLCLLTVCLQCVDISQSRRHMIYILIFAILHCGVAIVPALTVWAVLASTDSYDEDEYAVQSWMLSWVVWGAFSWILSTVYMYAGSVESERLAKTIQSVCLFLIGVDIGNVKLELKGDGQDSWELLGALCIFPSLASVMPAAIVGFIANYIFEQKFQLKCSADIETDLCFDNDFGCCTVVSSHDYDNIYIFAGGLASSILATWAVVRIIGYLMIHGAPKLSLYATKRR